MQWRLSMILSRNKDAEKATELVTPTVDQQVREGEPKAPAVRAKLDLVAAELAELESEMAALALAAAEGTSGAAAKLTAHRAKIDVATRAVTELQAALHLA